MAGVFQRAVEELYELSLFHAALFLIGFALNMAPQASLKPTGPCADRLYDHYVLVVRLTFFFILSTFCCAVLSSHVKRRVPDGGLQGVADIKKRVMLRVNAAIGCVLSVTASGLAVASSTFLIQAKTGVLKCFPTEVRVFVYVTYAVVAYVLGTVYFLCGMEILLEDVMSHLRECALVVVHGDPAKDCAGDPAKDCAEDEHGGQ